MGGEHLRSTARRGLAGIAVLTLAVPSGALAQQRDAASVTARFVIPPVVASGWTAPVPEGLSLALRSDTDEIAINGTTVSTWAAVPVSARITATLTDARGEAAAVVKTFGVRVLPAGTARYVLAYTRAPLEPHVYSTALAHSMHLAIDAAPGRFEALNENYGVLFAKAVPTGRVDFNEVRTMRSPFVFYQADGGFGVVATRADYDGAPDASARSSMLYFTSPDLRTFTEIGLVDLGTTTGVRDPRAIWDSALGQYLVSWIDSDGDVHSTTFAALDRPASRGEVRAGGPVLPHPPFPQPAAIAAVRGADLSNIVPSNILPVDAEVARRLEVRFGRIANVAVDVPDMSVAVGRAHGLDTLRAVLTYSDGSTAERPVIWDAEAVAAVDTDSPGTYTVEGTVKQTAYPFPFIRARADPTILRYRGQYYFIATYDDEGGHVGSPGMPIRAADSILELPGATETQILNPGPGDIQGCFWAPELHAFGGALHVLFAPCIGRESWQRVQAHVLELEPGGDPVRPDDWLPPRPVLQRDGTPLQLDPEHPGISLDMTYFEVEGESYVAWSQRYIVGDDIGDAEIWIATIDPADPYRLTGEPVRIVTAEYGWDHNHAAVAEGAFVVQRAGTVYMTYSGSAVGPTYVTGLATAPVGADLTDPAAWSKLSYPVLKTDRSIGQWGPGHNSFVRDEDGNLVLVYHAKTDPRSPERHTGLRRVHWASDGMPILDMTPEEEVAPELRRVRITVTVGPEAGRSPLQGGIR